MFFSYKNNPILYKIAKRSLGEDLFYLENEEQLSFDFKMNVVKQVWTQFAPYFKQVYYLEKAFADAIKTKGIFFEDKFDARSLVSLKEAIPCAGATLLYKDYIFCLFADPASYNYCLFVFYQNKQNRSLVLTTGFYAGSQASAAESLYIHTVGGCTLFRPYESVNFCVQMCSNLHFLQNLPDRHKTVLPAFGKVECQVGQVYQNNTNMNITLCGSMSPSKIIPLPS